MIITKIPAFPTTITLKSLIYLSKQVQDCLRPNLTTRWQNLLKYWRKNCSDLWKNLIGILLNKPRRMKICYQIVVVIKSRFAWACFIWFLRLNFCGQSDKSPLSSLITRIMKSWQTVEGSSWEDWLGLQCKLSNLCTCVD